MDNNVLDELNKTLEEREIPVASQQQSEQEQSSRRMITNVQPCMCARLGAPNGNSSFIYFSP